MDPHDRVVGWSMAGKVLAAGASKMGPVACIWRYDAGSPYILRLIIDPKGRALEWIIGRDLLRDGCNQLVAYQASDIRLYPYTMYPPGGSLIETLCIELSTPDGEASLFFRLAEMREILGETEKRVAFGAEADAQPVPEPGYFLTKGAGASEDV